MTTYAFIFARGGSKGLPRKNLKLLEGKPLIQYSIETAQRVKSIDRVFISTEDGEIATQAIKCGAEVIPRPKELASDSSNEWLSWQHAIEWVRRNIGEFDFFVSLPATSPLRIPSDVEASLEKLKNSEADVCISVTEASRSPYFNMVVRDQSGSVKIVNSLSNSPIRRQDTPKVFDITTVVYTSSPSYIMAHSALFEGDVTSIVVPKVRAVDIDDIYDFKLAEAILKEMQNA
ncbi:MAG: acylneuraminate cytidylyltransferase family protein [Aliiglaciecola sp.]|uniref:acylneuraminate cytidylyltransferase family protein n=1 Tax=Aliiglaciecola sp. M165 TaxID=2593649 RepID=UPI00117C63E0|nr:acylneuraminate cytidylyltransferase family protein [Aliiglaciecola sp. M165]TRY30952.1 acylneuraminate cytidylyltransferase family protein [Aliiglaciecola sp. M165]